MEPLSTERPALDATYILGADGGALVAVVVTAVEDGRVSCRRVGSGKGPTFTFGPDRFQEIAR